MPSSCISPPPSSSSYCTSLLTKASDEICHRTQVICICISLRPRLTSPITYSSIMSLPCLSPPTIAPATSSIQFRLVFSRSGHILTVLTLIRQYRALPWVLLSPFRLRPIFGVDYQSKSGSRILYAFWGFVLSGGGTAAARTSVLYSSIGFSRSFLLLSPCACSLPGHSSVDACPQCVFFTTSN